MNKYDELIGKLSLLVKRLEEKKNESNIKYSDILIEEENIKKEIETLDAEYEDIKNILKILNNYKRDVIKWCKKNWYYSLGRIVGSFLMFGAFGKLFSFFPPLSSEILIICILFSVFMTYRDFVKEEYEIKYINSEYSKNKEELVSKKHTLEENLEVKKVRLEEIDDLKPTLSKGCKTCENDLIRYKTLMYQVIGSRNLAFSLSNGKSEEINKVFEQDKRSLDVVRLVREYDKI